MAVSALVHRFLESRHGSPGWRRLTHIAERWRQLRTRRRNRSYRSIDLKGRFCLSPFREFQSYENGSVYLCCPDWLPTPAGNLNDQDARAIWNSGMARKIRASILDGSFKYCDRDQCHRIQSNDLPALEEAKADPLMRKIIEGGMVRMPDGPEYFNFMHDRSCNLVCPICRSEKISFTDGGAFNARKRVHDKIVDSFLAEPDDRMIDVVVTGSGDAMGSKLFREWLFTLNGADFPKLRINIMSNGVMLTPTNWGRMGKIFPNIHHVYVSFDAARRPTYDAIRVGGNWDVLLENTKYMGWLRAEGVIKQLRLDFVVQAGNFGEMVEFVDLARELGADGVNFTKINNGGNLTQGEFEAACIWRDRHPRHDEFLRLLADPKLDDPFVHLGNLYAVRKGAQQAMRN